MGRSTVGVKWIFAIFVGFSGVSDASRFSASPGGFVAGSGFLDIFSSRFVGSLVKLLGCAPRSGQAKIYVSFWRHFAWVPGSFVGSIVFLDTFSS